MKKTILILPVICITSAIIHHPSSMTYAQGVHPVSGEPLKYCGTCQATEELYRHHPALKQIADIIEEQQKNSPPTESSALPPVYTIPVVVHVLHSYGAENIPDANVVDAIYILNRDFRKLNSDTSQIVSAFKAIAADCEIEFQLAQLDPNGVCTNGIDRIVTSETYVGDDGSKLNQWPRNKYLNIWTVNNITSGAAGYTYLPINVNSFPSKDGIMILYDYFGSLSPSSISTSRTLTHEVGHWINLSHVWGNTNNPGVSCGDDAVSDTPITKGWVSCNLSSNDVCNPGTEENVQNYMEYSYCSKMFTTGQRTRMRNALNSATAQRINLWQSANLAATGVGAPAQLCTADFSVNKRVVCVGTTITLTDLSWNATPTSWQWDVDYNVSPSTDYTTQNPTHAYSSPGVYDVKLTVSDGVNTKTTTKTSYMIVLNNTASVFAPYIEGFETAGYPYNDCYVYFVNGTGPAWSRTTTAAYSGSASLKLNNYTATAGYLEDAIYPSTDLTNVISPQMTFRLAYAQRSSTDLDKLRLLTSTNCGTTWVQRYSKTGPQLATIGAGNYVTNSFTPDTSQWRKETVNIASLAGNSDFRFKFEFTEAEGTGNNVYLDDINIFGANGVEKTEENSFNISIFPNPFDENTTIAFTLSEKQTLAIGIYDVAGREIIPLSSAELSAGDYSLPIGKGTLEAGIYFVRMQAGAAQVVRKLIVQ